MTRTDDRASLAANPRATLAAWKRFDHHITCAQAGFPKVYELTPLSLSPSTFVSRARDAIRGAIEFGYVENPEALASWYASVSLWNDTEKVYIGPKGRKTEEPIVVKDSSPFTFTTLSDPELQAFALLLQNGRIQGPVKVLKAQNNTPITPNPNLQILKQPNGELILI